MGRNELKNRKPWQGKSGEAGQAAELLFQVILSTHLEDSHYEVTPKPKAFTTIYNQGKLVGNSIKGKHGVQIDFQIKNENSGKSIFVEMKRQKPGRGNAHERACKFFMPGMLAIGRELANQPDHVNPYWIVFSDGIASDPKRIEEITYWFQGLTGHFFLWKNIREKKHLIEHFENHIKPLLD